MSLCDLFGHKQVPRYYGRVVTGMIDGVGREHAHLMMDCARCGKEFQVGMLHIPKRHAEAQLEAEVERLAAGIMTEAVVEAAAKAIQRDASRRMASRDEIECLLRESARLVEVSHD